MIAKKHQAEGSWKTTKRPARQRYGIKIGEMRAISTWPSFGGSDGGWPEKSCLALQSSNHQTQMVSVTYRDSHSVFIQSRLLNIELLWDDGRQCELAHTTTLLTTLHNSTQEEQCKAKYSFPLPLPHPLEQEDGWGQGMEKKVRTNPLVKLKLKSSGRVF